MRSKRNPKNNYRTKAAENSMKTFFALLNLINQLVIHFTEIYVVKAFLSPCIMRTVSL